jgi:TRAP-type C4-dicarboxylate transport system substrate-binding protein
VNFNILSIRKAKWDAMTPAQQQRLQTASTDVANAITAQMVKEEAELVDFFKSAGLDVYTPDRTAFRNNALEVIRKSKFISEWKPGMLEAINAM